jgi:hypothetical protein
MTIEPRAIESVWGPPFAPIHVNRGGMIPLCRDPDTDTGQYMFAEGTADCTRCLQIFRARQES